MWNIQHVCSLNLDLKHRKKNKVMKKLILLALTALMMVGCENSESTNVKTTPTKVKKVVNKTPNKYEVLLSTKDIIYVEADSYHMYHGAFGTNTEPECYFYDIYGNDIQVIHNPVYVKKVTK